MDAERLDHLRARVAECDEVVAEHRDSPDPVAQRRLREASLRPGQPGSPGSRAAQWIARLLGP